MPLVVNWVLGREAFTDWAYINNFRRLSAHLPRFEHRVNSAGRTDVALYFDPLLARDHPVRCRASILRIGGPRPLDMIEADRPVRLAEVLRPSEAVIALNSALAQRVMQHHSNVFTIPNGLDLDLWQPKRLRGDPRRPFTVGFAANREGQKRSLKGFDIALRAADWADVPLLICDKREKQIPHERMIDKFYSRIDALIHPSVAEGSSNVIMEALSLGIPVVTTEAAGYHGERLKDGVNALIRHVDIAQFAGAIRLLRDDPPLGALIGEEGRRFAKAHHSISNVASDYARILEWAIGRVTSRRSRTFRDVLSQLTRSSARSRRSRSTPSATSP